jgi:hypothetical protein
MAALRKAKLYNRFENKFVDCQPVREHVQTLLDQGWGFRTIAAVSGVRLGQIQQLINGRSPSEMNQRYPRPQHLTRILKTNADKLLAVRYDMAKSPGGALTASKGTQRRIQALVANGYSLAWQAEQIGWVVQNFVGLLKKDQLQVNTAKLVDELFQKYAYKRRIGETKELKYSITRALNNAARNGWVTAAAWDDIDTDIAPPTQELSKAVDTVIVEELLMGRTVPVPHGTKRLYAKAMFDRGANFSFIQTVLRMSGTELKLVQN